MRKLLLILSILPLLTSCATPSWKGRTVESLIQNNGTPFSAYDIKGGRLIEYQWCGRFGLIEQLAHPWKSCKLWMFKTVDGITIADNWIVYK